MASDIPIVSGLGPRDIPNDADEANEMELLGVALSTRSSLNRSGVCLPVGRAIAYAKLQQRDAVLQEDFSIKNTTSQKFNTF